MFSSQPCIMFWLTSLPIATTFTVMLSLATAKGISEAGVPDTIGELLGLMFKAIFTMDSIGAVIGLSIGCVFLLIAVFTFTEKLTITDQRLSKDQIVRFWSWFSACTSLLLLLTMAGWYLCAPAQPSKEGMVFSHPKVIGEIYSFVEKGPIFADGYDDERIEEFNTRVAKMAIGIFKNESTDNCDNSTLIADITGMPFFIAFGFSLVGAVIWALMDLLKRLKDTINPKLPQKEQKEILPRHYLSYILRCVTAPFVAIVIAFFITISWPANSAPALFFFIGLFPKRGLEFISEIGTHMTTFSKDKQDNNPDQKEKEEKNEKEAIKKITDGTVSKGK